MSFKRSAKVPTKESFSGENAEEYSEARWMARIQKKTTRRALELLEDSKIGGALPPLVKHGGIALDLGCGNGFSSEILHDHGYAIIIGVDVSLDMLELNYLPFPRVLADMKHLPFRNGTFAFIISISAMNFISQEINDAGLTISIYNAFSRDLHDVLEADGRVVIEFYPKTSEELGIISKAFGRSISKLNSYLVIDKANTKKEQKFLIACK